MLPLPRQHSMESALYAARLMNVFERSGDLVAMTAVSDLVNGWPGGIIQAGRHGVYVTPTYRALRALRDDISAPSGSKPTVESPTFDVPGRAVRRAVVDVTASRPRTAAATTSRPSTRASTRPSACASAIDGWQPPARATQHTLTAPTLQHREHVRRAGRRRASARRQVAAGRAFTVDLPRHSVR